MKDIYYLPINSQTYSVSTFFCLNEARSSQFQRLFFSYYYSFKNQRIIQISIVMQMKQYQEIQVCKPQAKASPNEKLAKEFDSEHFQLYRQFMEEVKSNSEKKGLFASCKANLLEKGIIYNEEERIDRLILSVSNSSLNSEVVVFDVRWGGFYLQLKVLNVQSSSLYHNCQNLRGSYGDIYQINLEHLKFVIKCINFETFKEENEARSMAIKEIIILKIASAAKVGPQLSNIYGCDFICYNNCIQFAMEKCSNFSQLSEQEVYSLKENLYLLHKLQIFHFDIKPSNIMMSNINEKLVFIDFGLSQIINLAEGKKMPHHFRGTFDFCSRQMLAAFQKSTKRHIDLYYNDTHAFEKVIESVHFKNSIELININEDQLELFAPNNSIIENIVHLFKMNEHIEQQLLLFKVKFLLFSGEIEQVKSILNLYQLLDVKYIVTGILDFLYQIPQTYELRNLYHNQLKTHHKQGSAYLQLNETYRTNNMKILSHCSFPKNKGTFIRRSAQIIQVVSKDHLQIHSHIDIKNILLGNSQLQPQIKIKLLLEFIDFSNNIHKASMEDRYNLVKSLMEKESIDLNLQSKTFESKNDRENELNTIKLYMTYILHKILKSRNTALKRQKKLDLCIIERQNLLKLVEHIFLLQLGSTKQILKWLSSMLNRFFTKIEEKIELILKIKHSSLWLYYSMRSCNSQNIHQSYRLVLHWCKEQSKMIASETYHASAWMAAQIQKTLQPNSEYLQLQIIDKRIPHLCLHEIAYQLDALTNNFKHTHQKYHSFLQKAYQLIPLRQHSKTHFFLLNIYKDCLNTYGIFGLPEQIRDIIRSNLNCQVLFANSFISYYFDCYAAIYRNNNLKYFSSLFTFLSDTDEYTFIAHNQSVNLGVKVLHLIHETEQHQKKMIVKGNEQKQYKIILMNLRRILLNLLNSKTYTIYFSKNGEKQKCIDNCLFSNISDIAKIVTHIINHRYDILIDLRQLWSGFEKIDCSQCKINVFLSILIKFQTYLIADHQYGEQVFEKEFIENHCQINRIIQNQVRKEDSDSFNQMNVLSLMEFCCCSRQFQEKYGGISSAYYFLKERGLLNFYFNFSNSGFRFMYLTFFVLAKYDSMQQFASFLTFLSQSLTLSFSSAYFKLVFRAFSIFVNEIKNLVDLSHLIYQLKTIQKNQARQNQIKNRYNCIFFYVALFELPVPTLSSLRWKIVKSLDQVQPKIKLFFEAHILRFLLIENYKGMLIKPRKWAFIIKNMVKLFKRSQKMEAPIKIKQKSIKNKMLQEKALKLGGSFNLSFESMAIIHVKLKLRTLSDYSKVAKSKN